MFDTIMLILGYITASVLGTILGFYILLGLWLYLSRNIVLWYVVNKAHKKYPDGSVIKNDFREKSFWRVRLFLLIFSEWNTSGDETRCSDRWTIRYEGLKVSWEID